MHDSPMKGTQTLSYKLVFKRNGLRVIYAIMLLTLSPISLFFVRCFFNEPMAVTMTGTSTHGTTVLAEKKTFQNKHKIFLQKIHIYPGSAATLDGTFLFVVFCCSSSNTLNKPSPKVSAMFVRGTLPTIQHEVVFG